MPKNLCKKKKTTYTEELRAEEMSELFKKRDNYRGRFECEQVVFEKRYIKSRIEIIRESIKKEVKKTIKRVSNMHGCDADYIERYAGELKKLNIMWLETSDKLEMAVDEEFDLSTLIKASDDMCEMACSMDSKDFRTYNILPIWDVEHQTMVLSSAVQNYELVIDDYLNTLGSEGMIKFQKDDNGYAMREMIDTKFEKCLERSVNDSSAIDLAIKCIKEGAYVDLRLEGEEFKFCHKPCTALTYLLMRRDKQAVIELLKHGANVNIKMETENNEMMAPIMYAIKKDAGWDIIDLMLDNGAGVDIGKEISIGMLESAPMTRNNLLIMNLLNARVNEYKGSKKSVKSYLRESRNDNVVLADAVERLEKKGNEEVMFSKVSLKGEFRRTKVDIRSEKEFDLVNRSRNKKNSNICSMFN